MSAYKVPQIQTSEQEVEVGQHYQYVEGGLVMVGGAQNPSRGDNDCVANVTVLSAVDNGGRVTLELRIDNLVRWPHTWDGVGAIFECTTIENPSPASWRLVDAGTYS